MENRYQSVLETFDKVAAAYQEKFMDLDSYNDGFDLFCSLLEKPGARILELGCGPGNITRYLLAQRPDFQIEGIDIAPNMIELARQNNPSARFNIMDVREIDRLSGPFDGIMCGFCTPYLSKEECFKLIKDAATLLPAGGAFYCSTMEDDYEKSDFVTSSNGEHTMFTYFHQADYLQEQLETEGFEVVSFKRQEYIKDNGARFTDMIFIARKRQA